VVGHTPSELVPERHDTIRIRYDVIERLHQIHLSARTPAPAPVALHHALVRCDRDGLHRAVLRLRALIRHPPDGAEAIHRWRRLHAAISWSSRLESAKCAQHELYRS